MPGDTGYVPLSAHDLIDTTPREPRYEQPQAQKSHQSSEPRSNPYEVVTESSDKPKAGWWRRLTGQ
jgi:hypothetical protein